MLERKVIEFCAPTLAGLKTAGLFNYKFEKETCLKEELRAINKKLNSKGIFVEALNQKELQALVFVYRQKRLEADLNTRGAKELLVKMGYEKLEWRACLEELKARLWKYQCFPHEIGLFLGYPLCDVVGFIEQKGKNYKCVGPWKVYGNETEMIKVFCRLKKCREVYGKLFDEGRSIQKLTVAA